MTATLPLALVSFIGDLERLLASFEPVEPAAPPSARKRFSSSYGNDSATPPFSHFTRLETVS